MNRGARSAPVRMRDFVAFLSKRDKTTYAWHLSRVLSGNRNVLSVGDEPTLPRPTNKFCQVVKLHALLVLFFFCSPSPPCPPPSPRSCVPLLPPCPPDPTEERGTFSRNPARFGPVARFHFFFFVSLRGPTKVIGWPCSAPMALFSPSRRLIYCPFNWIILMGRSRAFWLRAPSQAVQYRPPSSSSACPLPFRFTVGRRLSGRKFAERSIYGTCRFGLVAGGIVELEVR